LKEKKNKKINKKSLKKSLLVKRLLKKIFEGKDPYGCRLCIPQSYQPIGIMNIVIYVASSGRYYAKE
tara:strand:+ start:20 stop:220 length:201 start_codon:yes stop_codon:yes gene_type:complete